MNSQSNSSNEPILKFEGKKYNINSLPDDIKELIKALSVADNQLRFHEDMLKILALGRQSIARQLNENLKNVRPIE